MLIKSGYLTYLPHLALPLAASYVVMPLEQDESSRIVQIINRKENVGFFIVVRFGDKRLTITTRIIPKYKNFQYLINKKRKPGFPLFAIS